MASFEVFARVRIPLDADDSADAERKVGAILKHAVENKGFEVQQVRAMPGKHATVAERSAEREIDAATKLLRSLSAEYFTERTASLASPHKRRWRGETIDEFPMSLEVAGFPVTGSVIHIPQDLRKEPSGGDPNAGVGSDAGETFDVPAGHSLYAWNATAEMSNEDVGRAGALAKDITKHLMNLVQSRLKGNIVHSISRTDMQVPEEIPVAVSQGVFSTELEPRHIGTALSEKSGIRSILPKSVAEDEGFNKHLGGILRLLK